MVQETSIGGGGSAFPTTRWTLIISSRERPEQRRAALSELLAAYWKPLYFYVRRKGHDIESAKDAIQGFYAHLLERDFLERLDPLKGSFRAYLRMALDHYLANAHEAQAALKRGGGARTLSLEVDVAETQLASATSADPVAAYEREWALGVMERALAKLEHEFEDGTRRGDFAAVRRFFQPGEAPLGYVEAAALAGMTAPRFKAFLHRARTRFRELLRLEVAETVPSADDTDAEMHDLLEALG
jgi:DNA-directed RNA polymerase specialized sigma24 family protein